MSFYTLVGYYENGDLFFIRKGLIVIKKTSKQLTLQSISSIDFQLTVNINSSGHLELVGVTDNKLYLYELSQNPMLGLTHDDIRQAHLLQTIIFDPTHTGYNTSTGRVCFTEQSTKKTTFVEFSTNFISDYRLSIYGPIINIQTS